MEGNSEIPERLTRHGYYFREAIVDEARAIVGQRTTPQIIRSEMDSPGCLMPIDRGLSSVFSKM